MRSCSCVVTCPTPLPAAPCCSLVMALLRYCMSACWDLWASLWRCTEAGETVETPGRACDSKGRRTVKLVLTHASQKRANSWVRMKRLYASLAISLESHKKGVTHQSVVRLSLRVAKEERTDRCHLELAIAQPLRSCGA